MKNSNLDLITDKNISGLHPTIKDDVEHCINNLSNIGIGVRVTFGFRTFAEQDKLYAQGRTEQGVIVTNAKGGDSIHNYGLAVDCVEISPVYGYNPNYPDSRWNDIAKVFKSKGFEWGGDWQKFPDKPHFQKTFGLTLKQLKAKYKEGEFVDVGIIIKGQNISKAD